MDIDDITNALKQGWLGGLALVVVMLKDTKISSAIWNFFVKSQEKKEKKSETYDQIAIETVKRTLDNSIELPSKLSNLEYLLANQGDMLEELLRSVRALNMESSINEKKLNQIISLATNLNQISSEMRNCLSSCDKKGKK